ncbi:39S ribosomal protein L47 [Hibiscus syriacus]|uniref:39S ribosomal protein L47 n=1 Tax=Hibiscus syriacus TaxID=106335 RepID=A0A6A3AYV3_HIBSY|nr:39S ribosomal protein L47 [Hibiscus syriacus]
MHGRGGGEERKKARHMWTLPTRATAVLSGDGGASLSSSSSSTVNFFSKDGRRISVGDCALFKPPQDSPPFIGIIRCLTSDKENKLNLCVNWFYRPAEVKLGKCILLEAAPNEIFYSFHEDEIPAASLLHPCKVAFLPKDFELPSGICSFVCRRVYDITNKCLWWLTDQDFIDERQEEVDQLLYETHLEMHAAVQQGGRSPKPINGLSSTSQLKPGSDSIQNSASSFPSLGKGKKRERGDQGLAPVKRERNSKMDDGDSGRGRPEVNLESEIAKIAEKGGLEDFSGVEKLVQLMLSEGNEKKIDLVNRSMLACVIAATDKFDCLSHFVQLRGLLVFDEWLQEVHKGKIGDGSGPKDDRSVDDFLLTLLQALDKLPVNLTALQICNIGKSVNHLRSHKNIEIQKKARSLVDTWKKRVEAEMDAKSGSNQAVPWSARARLSEVSHGGSKHSGPSEVAMKSSLIQLSASKTCSVKIAQGETTTKPASASLGPMKAATSPASASTNLKDGEAQKAPVGGTSDPHAITRDEKSSSSTQSHNNSQSCSSDHGKTRGVSGKEDARSSPAGLGTVAKISGSSSRHRKSINGFLGTSGVQGEARSSKNSSSYRNPASEKISQSGLTCEKVLEPPMVQSNSHKFTVKIPNRGRSPAQSASGGSLEDHSVMNSRASSPVLSDKPEQLDRNMKEKSDSYRANVISDVNPESWQSNDFKDVLTMSDEGNGSPAAVPGEEDCRNGEVSRKTADATKTASSSSGNELKSWKLQEASFSSIIALIDSVKYTEASECLPVGDDVGMNLLASVATGDFSKSNLASPIDYPLRNILLIEHSSTGNDTELKPHSGGKIVRNQYQSADSADDPYQKQGVAAGNYWAKNADSKTGSALENFGELNEHLSSSRMALPQIADQCLENGKLKEVITAALVSMSARSMEKTTNIRDSKEHMEKRSFGVDDDCSVDAKQKGSASVVDEEVIDPVVKVEKEVVEGSSSVPSTEVGVDSKKIATEGSERGSQAHQKLSVVIGHSIKETYQEALPTCPTKDITLENVDEAKPEKDVEIDASSHASKKPESEAITAQKGEHMQDNMQCSEGHEPPGGPSPCKASPEQPKKPRGSKVTGVEADQAEECTSVTTETPRIGVADTDAKVEFDLNIDFNAEEGKSVEPNNLKGVGCSAPVQLISSLAFPVSSVSGSLPASITVAAAAKGPFVPPNDLLRTKGELGWKGSAATSAFRPAEPRKSLDMPLGTSNTSIPDATTGKQSRPPLDIDLNVPDEKVLEDLHVTDSAPDLSNNSDLKCEPVGSAPYCSSDGLDLDLNRVDEPADLGHSSGGGRKIDAPMHHVKSAFRILNGEASFCRDFDLNNGPTVDEVTAVPSQFSHHSRNSNVLSQAPVSGLQISNTEMAKFSSWFPVGNTFSAVTIPSILPDREQPFPIVATGGPQRVLAPPTASTPYDSDIFRGSVLSSAPAVPFPSTPFQYPVFPFGPTFPLPSTSFSGSSITYADSSSGGRFCFPPVHLQLLGPAGAVPSHYPRPPYVVSLPDGSYNSGAEGGKKWGRQGLDLNAGPGGPDIEGRDETAPLASRHLSVGSSLALAEEQARMYNVSGGVLERSLREDGMDTSNLHGSRNH